MRRAARTLPALGAVLAALVVLPASAFAATNTFTGLAATSDWNTGGNWSDGVPTSDDDVVINNTHSVTLSTGNADVNSVVLNGGLTVSGPTLTVGAGTSTIAAALNLTGGATVALGAQTTWSAGNISFNSGGGTLQIGVGDVLDITGSGVVSLNFAGGLWHNAGTVNTDATTANIGVPFENDGAVNVNAGTLVMGQGDGAGSSNGVYLAAASALLNFTGGAVEVAGATSRIGGAGSVQLSGGSVSVAADATFDPTTLTLGSGTLTLAPNATVTTLNATGGTRAGAGTLTVGGVASLGGLTLNGAATTNLNGSAQITAGLDMTGGHTLNMPPAATWSGGNISFNSGGGTLQIGVGDVLDITGAGVGSLNFNNGLWTNAGTINTNATTAQIGVPFENDGAVNVNAGIFELGQGDGAGSSSGTYLVAPSALLRITGGGVEVAGAAARIGGAGTVQLTASSPTVSVAADATFDPTTLTLGSGTLTLAPNATVTTLNATGGTRSGAGTLTVSGVASLGGLTLAGAATTNLTGSAQITAGLDMTGGHTLNMPPAATWSGGNISFNSGGGTLQIGAGDVLDITGAGLASLNFNNGLWTNAGTVNRTTSATTAQIGVPFENDGAVNVNVGTLAMDQGLTQTSGTSTVAGGATLGGTLAIQGGALQGAGTAGGNVTNSGGTVRAGTSPGTLTIGGDYTQGPAGTLEVDVTGTAQGTDPGHDHLEVSGAATLDGTVAVIQGGGFDPDPLDTFQFLTSASRTGTFSAITGASLPSGDAYVLVYPAGPDFGARLVVNAAPPPPQNTAPPSIPATATTGEVVSCDPGSWTGLPSFGFQWMRDGAAIVGATSQAYTVAAEDVGTTIQCQVTATNGGGSASADSNALVPTAPAGPASGAAAPSSPAPPAAPPATPTQTIRGEEAFVQGTPNDLYLACTKLDLLLIDVLPAGRKKVAVTGSADLRLAGRTAEILLDGKPVGKASIAANGSFAKKVAAPSPKRRRKARYQARVGTTRSQRLQLERRMIATALTRAGRNLTLRGVVSKPFAKRPAAIEVQRFVACGRLEKVVVRRVVPNSRGAFAVTFPAPAAGSAAIYRARTRVATRTRGPATAPTFTLPRAIALG